MSLSHFKHIPKAWTNQWLLRNAVGLQSTCGLHTTPAACKVQSGRYKVTTDRSRPLTYEMANQPCQIAHRKSWNTWNTTSLLDGQREPETVVEDIFIRKFMNGTWHDLFVSEVIIKRQHNMIRIAGIVQQRIAARKMYFLIGYCEELLSYWLKCPVKLEIQTVTDKKSVIYKYI
ncbi:small ribosomal subunit protein uS3m [Penaeus vannamei]|uniref:Putative 28S ribosomal protein S24, mitochondrial n=1 Tax=Penaeus vannamei TaxID=6689 RepID=A0A423TK63_PENVA|nr:28S ribosomal protein S24, mitochondrial-like [Penaeus vannamei]XP_027219182.1 28S ribosomal protein S24, mitochondrial-like [Penaeus vannamei]XP_027219185.1 28S ribosomal protein S24, mitochondrial-like [Penaeus vannamei]ROT71883.1 putative 28S ribosomal protein S24, mitochondrial [Penaeus vannamei]ROT76852.1 putative 28S ribosomal protein S24, mitochondrial [Penaeus vannamei]